MHGAHMRLAVLGTAVAAVAATGAIAAGGGVSRIPTYRHSQTLAPDYGLGGPGTVAMSDDGSTSLVDIPQVGAVIYTRAGRSWIARQTIPGLSGGPLSAHGDTILVQGKGPGLTTDVFAYVRTGMGWVLQQRLPDPSADPVRSRANGWNMQLSGDGDTAFVLNTSAAVAGLGTGHIYVFTRAGGTWSIAQDLPVTRVDSSSTLSTSSDASTIVVQTQQYVGQEVQTFSRSAGSWTPQGAPLVIGEGYAAGATGTGRTVLSSDGTIAFVGDPARDRSSGAAYVITRTGGTWTHRQTIRPPSGGGGEFGTVALTGNANTAVVGDPGYGIPVAAYGGGCGDPSHQPPGAVHVYRRTGRIWTLSQTIRNPIRGGVYFGAAAISANGADGMVAPDQLCNRGFPFAVAVLRAQTTRVHGLVVRWSVTSGAVRGLVTPVRGARHYTVYATTSGDTGQTGTCRVAVTPVGRRVRCVLPIGAGVWRVTAQAESASGVIAQSARTVRIAGARASG
jgi:hypothetical protein